MTVLKQTLNLILGLSVMVLVIGSIMFLALKASNFINKKNGENKY